MPTYEYKCQKCQCRFEVFQSMNDKPLTECTTCHGPVKRLIGAGAGLLFRGNGFYATDYRSESYKKAASSASETPAAPAAKPADSPAAKTGATEKKSP